MNLIKQIEIAARDLPPNYIIFLGVENGSAWVELRVGYFESETIQFDITDLDLADQVQKALELAVQHHDDLKRLGVVENGV